MEGHKKQATTQVTNQPKQPKQPNQPNQPNKKANQTNQANQPNQTNPCLQSQTRRPEEGEPLCVSKRVGEGSVEGGVVLTLLVEELHVLALEPCQLPRSNSVSDHRRA